MLARSAEESESIRRIIKFFKLGMHPKQKQNQTRFWQYPDNFEVMLFTPETKYMFNIGTCALQNMDVGYAGSGGGIPSFFEDTKAPVHVTLSLQFRELKVLTQDDIEADF